MITPPQSSPAASLPSTEDDACPLEIAVPLCEGAANPLGLERRQPRFCWKLLSAKRDQHQSAWQILAASDERLLLPGKADLWDSGKVSGPEGRRTTAIPYNGSVALRSRQRCHWCVRVWDRDDIPSAFSAPQHWEMALLDPADWRAEWIGYPAGCTGRALYFRHVFEIREQKAVRQARAYIVGLGYHELRLNGQKVGDHVLDPGWTDYAKRILYVTHDITAHLQTGQNAVGVIVGHGWFGAPILRLQLEVTYTDGGTEIICSQGQSNAPRLWFVNAGPLLSDSIYDGEAYDARLECDGWDQPSPLPPPSCRDEFWDTAVPVSPPAGRLVAQTNEPIKIVETFSPIAMREPQTGVFVFDAGRNLAGWARLRVEGPRGARITLRFAENLHPDDGTVDQRALRKAAATDTCILRGGGKPEQWEPRFTYHGFRYVQVEGLPRSQAGLHTLDIRVVRSAVPRNGSFTCGNDLLNRIQTAVVNTEASNLHSVPTDCPQRNERMGWLNDMTVRAEQALYNFRLDRFYEKWLEDIADTQSEDGAITDTAPFKWGKRPADPVCVSYLLLAGLCHAHYNDIEFVRRHYAGFERWTNYLLSRADNFVVNYSSWGDWAPPGNFAVAGSDGGGAIAANTPGPLMSTGFLFYHTTLLARMARLLGHPAAEIAHWENIARHVASAFNKKFRDETAGGYGTNNQACNALALFLGLASPAHTPRVVANLVADIERHDGHLTTGNLCTKYLFEVLSDHGHVDIAFRLATQTTYPGWGYMLENGATTLWERWEHLTGASMNSHNHPMHGSVSSWFYKYLAGIRLEPGGAGFVRIVIHPHFPRQLDWVEASCDSPHGRIESAWTKQNARLSLRLAIPVNANAVVHLPAANAGLIQENGIPITTIPDIRKITANAGLVSFEIGSGNYRLEIASS
ncbi:MAG: glycoside hydrolase family 78 protein [Opitutaceae bacterium]|jgi:alpha-L-rhamnosidase|nr:glycoside hydrolase family 78 protein [Opitutaceae bacterium]